MVSETNLPAQLNQRVARFVPNSDQLLPSYLLQVIQTPLFYEQVLADTTGTAQFNVSTIDIERVVLSLPSVVEQARIVLAIASEIDPLTRAIIRTERQIDLLREYRTRLIADVVTGKLDAREAAKRLPEAGTEADATTGELENLEYEENEQTKEVSTDKA